MKKEEAKKKGKKRSFDIAFQLKVVECAEKSTNRGAAAKYKVDEKSIRMWRKYHKQENFVRIKVCVFLKKRILRICNLTNADKKLIIHM